MDNGSPDLLPKGLQNSANKRISTNLSTNGAAKPNCGQLLPEDPDWTAMCRELAPDRRLCQWRREGQTENQLKPTSTHRPSFPPLPSSRHNRAGFTDS